MSCFHFEATVSLIQPNFINHLNNTQLSPILNSMSLHTPYRRGTANCFVRFNLTLFGLALFSSYVPVRGSILYPVFPLTPVSRFLVCPPPPPWSLQVRHFLLLIWIAELLSSATLFSLYDSSSPLRDIHSPLAAFLGSYLVPNQALYIRL